VNHGLKNIYIQMFQKFYKNMEKYKGGQAWDSRSSLSGSKLDALASKKNATLFFWQAFSIKVWIPGNANLSEKRSHAGVDPMVAKNRINLVRRLPLSPSLLGSLLCSFFGSLLSHLLEKVSSCKFRFHECLEVVFHAEVCLIHSAENRHTSGHVYMSAKEDPESSVGYRKSGLT
jgi:hypothetical protein